MLCSWQQRAEQEQYSRKSAAERRMEEAAAWEAEKAEAKQAKVRTLHTENGTDLHQKLQTNVVMVPSCCGFAPSEHEVSVVSTIPLITTNTAPSGAI